MSEWARGVIEKAEPCGIKFSTIQPGFVIYVQWANERARELYVRVEPTLVTRQAELLWTLVAMEYVGHTDTNGRTGISPGHRKAQ